MKKKEKPGFDIERLGSDAMKVASPEAKVKIERIIIDLTDRLIGQVPLAQKSIARVISHYEKLGRNNIYIDDEHIQIHSSHFPHRVYIKDVIERSGYKVPSGFEYASQVALRAGMPVRAVEILEKAGYIESAAALARNTGQAEKAIELYEKFDLEEAVKVAKSAGNIMKSQELERELLTSIVIKEGPVSAASRDLATRIASEGRGNYVTQAYLQALESLEQKKDGSLTYRGRENAKKRVQIASLLGIQDKAETVIAGFENEKEFYAAAECAVIIGQKERALRNYMAASGKEFSQDYTAEISKLVSELSK